MNLDPTVSPWIGIFASTGVCLWMAVIGAPLAKAVFGERPSPVWPFYAPALGIVAVLLTTNLSAYVIPGAPSAWFGLLAPSALAAFVAWRSGPLRPPLSFSDRVRTAVASLALLLASVGVYLFALANRTQVFQDDDFFHYALTLRLARGVFPPVAPYGVDAGVGYHYGPTLMAASIVNTAAVPSWTAVIVLGCFLIAALILAVTGFALDKSGSLPLSIGIGAALGLSQGPMLVGLPPYVEASGQSEGFLWFLEGLAPAEASNPFSLLNKSQYPLALIVVVLVTAAIDRRVTSRTAFVLAIAAGVSALAESSVMIFSSAALGLVIVLRLVWLRSRDRLTLATALLIGGSLALLAGGSASDALFRRGGTAGMVRIEFEPEWAGMTPFELAGPALIQVGIIPLVAFTAIVAYRRRSWGLAYLTAAGFFGMVESVFVHSPTPANDGRILTMATTISAFAALTATGSLLSTLRGKWHIAATLAALIFAILPMVVPRATAGVRLASNGFGVGQPVAAGPGYPLVDQTPSRRELFRKDLEDNWDYYSRLSEFLPNEARLLTTHPAGSAAAAGVAAPTSGLSLQVLSPRVTPVYEDALRFLHRDDLADMKISHLHLTDAWYRVLSPEAQKLFENPEHFNLVMEFRSISGKRHRVYEALPDAGSTQINPSSFRALRQSISASQPVVILDGLSEFQRQMLLYTFVDHPDLNSPYTFFDRTARLPHVRPVSDIPNRATVVMPESIEPLMLGLTSDDAIWTGYGIRVYDLASAWSPVWRVGVDFPPASEHLRLLCERSSSGDLDLKLLGEPGDEVLFGLTNVRLTGKSQMSDATAKSCQTLRLAAKSIINPFAQTRPKRSGNSVQPGENNSALGIDGGHDGNRVIINLWYRNPSQTAFAAASDFRVYEIGATGVTPRHPNPLVSIRWWPGPFTLSADTQMTRVEFDPRRLRINGDYGSGRSNDIVAGRMYLLKLNLSVIGTQSGLAVIQQQIPLVRFKAGDASWMAEVFSGIVSIREPMEASGLAHEYNSKIGRETDRTPGFETNEV